MREENYQRAIFIEPIPVLFLPPFLSRPFWVPSPRERVLQKSKYGSVAGFATDPCFF